MPAKITFLFLLLLLRVAGYGQDYPDDSVLVRILRSDRLLPLLTDSAIQNSAEVKRMGQYVSLYEQNLQTAKKNIFNSVLLNSTYGYGNIGNIAMEKDPTIANPLLHATSVRSSRYNLGVSLQLPLGNFLSRKNTTRSAELQISMAESEKEAAALVTRREVIRLYQEMKLSHALLITSGRMQQASALNLQMAQKQFIDGQVGLEQLTKLQNEYGQIVMQHDTQVNRFQTSFLLLEAYAGVQLMRLIARMK